MDWNIAGHKRQLEFLEQIINKNRLAHAYVFAGPDGVGKKMVAKRLAMALLGEGNPNAFQPDLLEIDGRNGIKIEQIRDLIYKLSLKAYMAKYKVAVIDAAHNLTDEAQNALLKSIEEPKSNTIIILVTSAPDRLKKTILSRAQKINFGGVDFPEYQHLLPKKLSDEQKRLIQDFASEKPGFALKISLDEAFLSLLGKVERQLREFLSDDHSKRLVLVNELAESEPEELLQTLDLWQNRLESDLKTRPVKISAARITQVNEARSLLNQNINTKLTLTNLMLQVHA